ncbi:MAG TPA: hypothetical protein VN744_04750 [Casimicrobiaceae bacterium]|nr:hypothetical protein [Casimicrobiaceae bacterium]
MGLQHGTFSVAAPSEGTLEAPRQHQAGGKAADSPYADDPGWEADIVKLEQRSTEAFLERDLRQLDALFSDELLINSPIDRIHATKRAPNIRLQLTNAQSIVIACKLSRAFAAELAFSWQRVWTR